MKNSSASKQKAERMTKMADEVAEEVLSGKELSEYALSHKEREVVITRIAMKLIGHGVNIEQLDILKKVKKLENLTWEEIGEIKRRYRYIQKNFLENFRF